MNNPVYIIFFKNGTDILCITNISLYKYIIGIFKEETSKLIEELKGKYINKLGLNVEEINNKVEQRTTAKSEKNYELADQIRTELDQKGIILNDSKDGTTWDIKELYNVM